jgi:hypothetical protein
VKTAHILDAGPLSEACGSGVAFRPSGARYKPCHGETATDRPRCFGRSLSPRLMRRPRSFRWRTVSGSGTDTPSGISSAPARAAVRNSIPRDMPASLSRCTLPTRTNRSATALSVLRRTHDHHRNLPTLGAAARAASLSRTNRDYDAMTRHGPRPRYVVAASVRRSIRCVLIDTPVPLCTQTPDAISHFACPWPRISTSIARKDLRNGNPEEHGQRGTRHPRHSQLLKSP